MLSNNLLGECERATHTVYDRMDAAATINFSVQSGAATIREQRLFESGVYFVQSGYRNSSQL